MKIIPLELGGAYLVEPKVFGDPRGFFMEFWNERKFADQNLRIQFVQDNLSRSSRGVLRGLHFQNPHPQGKLVSVLEGEVYDVIVDLRKGSPSFGKWVGVYLSSETKQQLFVPSGFAHGFLVTSETALFFYKCTEFYNPDSERSLRWDDPSINISWPLEKPLVSEKDQKGLFLKNIPADQLFHFSES